MINELQARIKKVESNLLLLKEAPQEPEERRRIVKKVVGDAQKYLEEELSFLRRLLSYYANNL